ncbi:hypothetical protein D9758_000885 [Tetrapyrgos nigripes]|uniref:Uncharacterized protein n=1 Tax=Tetrapyrgos nigripes TaxID=182062 RepID=A0A8H5LY80_9AGAR|nr:hypothetical protein D9758_000885 [Tetrapyrgos nigripes]
MLQNPTKEKRKTSSSSSFKVSKRFEDAIDATSDMTSNFLGISIVVFDALKDASIAAPFPYAFIAASLALQIVEAVQGAKDNKITLQRLARDSCELMYMVMTTLKELVQAECSDEVVKDASLNNHLEKLKQTLEEILQFAVKRSNRSRMKRMASSKGDVGRIQEYRERLKQALDIFGLQSTITVRSSLVRLAARQETFHEILNERIPSKDITDSLPFESSYPERSELSGMITNDLVPSPTATIIPESSPHELVLDNGEELCVSPVDETATGAESSTSRSPEKDASTAETAQAAVFCFTGSGINIAGVTFNNYSTSHSSVNNVNNSSLRNCGNTYYWGSGPCSDSQGLPSMGGNAGRLFEVVEY